MENTQKGFIVPLLIIIAALVIGGSVYVYTRKFVVKISGININQTTATTTNIVGNDRDIHGCIGSAGYSWCSVKNKCLRIWEEKCETVTTDIVTHATSSRPVTVSSVSTLQYPWSNANGVETQPGWHFVINLSEKVDKPVVNVSCSDGINKKVSLTFVSSTENGYEYETQDYVGLAPQGKCTAEIVTE